MRTKSIRLTEAEAEELRRYVDASGEVEATALKRAALRGLRDLRLEQGILAYLKDRDSAAAAEVAGLGRAEFLQVLLDRGITILEGPSTLLEEAGALAELTGSTRLATAARQLAERAQAGA
jgi:predicted HTH domain antitoxin